ncbi:MAG: GNAT family N-acetyltransferase [Gammaproteobacteria bacterium]|nr:GNAT family N-acetyltransferase [Gammaproteobacteria bacterium]
MKFLELTHLNREQCKQLNDLIILIQKNQQYAPTVYWHIIKKIRPYPCNILVYSGNQLVGFASRFLFHEKNCEMSLILHPQFQDEYFAKQLFSSLLKYIPQEYKDNIVMCSAHEHKPFIKPHAEWQLLHHSYRLKWQGPAKKPAPLKDYQFGKASSDDFLGFKKLLDIGFPHGTDMTPEIYQTIIDSPYTQLWLLKKNEHVIGAIQINQENKWCRISDITVHPEYRRHGLGEFLLMSIIHNLHQRQKAICLDVESTNPVAYEWYLRRGMKKINCCDFWTIPTQKLFNTP